MLEGSSAEQQGKDPSPPAIADRGQTLEALRSTEAFVNAIVENIPNMIFVKDARELRFVRHNRAGEELLGYKREELIGKNDYDFFPKEEADAFTARDHAVLQGGCVVDIAEEPIHTRYRGLRILHTTKVPILDENGVPKYLLGISEDITDRKQAELDRQARDTAEAANRAKDQFIAMLSHELRTPLTPVLVAAQLMEMDEALPAAQRESAAMVRRNVELEVLLIDDLLDITRISRGKLVLHPQRVDLHQLLGHVLEICGAELRSKHLTMTVQLNASGHHVGGDAARLQQVVWNLLNNAIKFTPAGGSITLRTEQVAEDRLAMSVSDTGVGISPELMPHIFNAFEQGGQATTCRFGGLGLGLAISKGIVDLHGGVLTAHSAGKGHGATFTVELRTSVETAPAEPKGDATIIDLDHHRSGRVLLVEDHTDTAVILARLLKGYGYEVRIADGVASAIRVATSEAFDLLLCDIGLPDGSGLDLMRQLTAMRGPIRAIALSGYGMEEDIARSKEAGFLEHLTKPVNLRQLEEALDRLNATPP